MSSMPCPPCRSVHSRAGVAPRTPLELATTLAIRSSKAAATSAALPFGPWPATTIRVASTAHSACSASTARLIAQARFATAEPSQGSVALSSSPSQADTTHAAHPRRNAIAAQPMWPLGVSSTGGRALPSPPEGRTSWPAIAAPEV